MVPTVVPHQILRGCSDGRNGYRRLVTSADSGWSETCIEVDHPSILKGVGTEQVGPGSRMSRKSWQISRWVFQFSLHSITLGS